jgi:hypothetical protein
MKALAVAAAALALFAAPALAKDAPDPNDHLLRDTVLTMPKLKAYEAAYTALTTAAKGDKSLAADIAAASAEHDPTIADTIAKMDHHPRVYAFFQKQGIGKQDAALVPIVVMEACTAVQYPEVIKGMADTLSPAQVDFCKANGTAIKALHVFNGQ